ncbi:MAG: hypothetical protein GC162_19040 [Planctomycetes bacterium]|nr:hypothetical protein [Planctomycetota bacterium]
MARRISGDFHADDRTAARTEAGRTRGHPGVDRDGADRRSARRAEMDLVDRAMRGETLMSTASKNRLDMRRVRIDPGIAMRIPSHLALRRRVLPLSASKECVYIACAQLPEPSTVEALERFTGLKVAPQLADEASLDEAIRLIYAESQSGPRSAGFAATSPSARMRSIDVAATSAEMDPQEVVTLTSELLYAAAIQDASDIHLDPTRQGLRIRLRIDGQLEDYRTIPISWHSPIISRLKVLSGMDIAEKRAPQDGGFAHRIGGGLSARTIDIRSATLPTRHGERMTLRLLGLKTDALTLNNLGMSAVHMSCVRQMLAQPSGLVLLTGPTGSGKTTTLYAMIRQLIAHESLNVLTIEDPVEYEIDGVSQVEVDGRDKVSFAKALRSALRHDPDVLMIGEVRDAESLDIALKASLTGHLVLSTLHTNSAASVVTRMRDMGAADYLIAATLRLCVAQRLVRRLCMEPGCRKTRPLMHHEAVALGDAALAGREVAEPGGCVYCAHRGYHGRLGLFEMLRINAVLVDLISRGADENELFRNRTAEYPPLAADAAAKVLAGLVAPGEAIQAIETF